MIRGTRFLLLSIALAAALLLGAPGSDDKPFQPGKAGDYAHQLSEQVLVGAKAFDNADLTTEAFGKKADLLKYGVLPVLVVIENKRDKSINLQDLEVSLVAADGRHVAATSPDDIQFIANGWTPNAEPAWRRVADPTAQEKKSVGGTGDFSAGLCRKDASAWRFDQWIFLFRGAVGGGR